LLIVFQMIVIIYIRGEIACGIYAFEAVTEPAVKSVGFGGNDFAADAGDGGGVSLVAVGDSSGGGVGVVTGVFHILCIAEVAVAIGVFVNTILDDVLDELFAAVAGILLKNKEVK